jgi:hypothetical protein
LIKKGGMKSEIKITGLIEIDGQQIVFKKGRKGSQGSSKVKCEVMKFEC